VRACGRIQSPVLVGRGVRAHLAHNEADAAQAWADRVTVVLTARAIPGTLPAIDHARGLVLLARGDVSAAHQVLETASGAWRARGADNPADMINRGARRCVMIVLEVLGGGPCRNT
jgi:hypothetical protein